jgi:hypothetical protein
MKAPVFPETGAIADLGALKGGAAQSSRLSPVNPD